jgi:hypothetical protein
MAIWRKAKDHYAAASRMSSAVARKTLAGPLTIVLRPDTIPGYDPLTGAPRAA